MTAPAHTSIQRDPNVMRWVCPTCGIDVHGGPNSPTHAQHQADMLAAAGLLVGPDAPTSAQVDELLRRTITLAQQTPGATLDGSLALLKAACDVLTMAGQFRRQGGEG